MKNLNPNWITKTTHTRLYNIPVPIIGLTGGIATGKTSVAKLFSDINIPVISADQLVKSIYAKEESIQFIKSHYPEVVKNNVIDFKKLRELFFQSQIVQQTIEEFIYKRMPDEFKKFFNEFSHASMLIYDVPLLFEKKLHESVDCSICVYTKAEVQLQRLIKRDGISEELAKNIISKQFPLEEKKKLSTFILENNDGLEELSRNFKLLLNQLN